MRIMNIRISEKKLITDYSVNTGGFIDVSNCGYNATAPVLILDKQRSFRNIMNNENEVCFTVKRHICSKRCTDSEIKPIFKGRKSSLLLIQCGFIIDILDSLKHSKQWMNGDEGSIEQRVNDLLVWSALCLVCGND